MGTQRSLAFSHPDQVRLLEAVRTALPRIVAGHEERRMFGGVTMMFNGNMLCCVARQGLMVRVGAESEPAALARPGARPCMGAGRRMAGFIMVDHDAVTNPHAVADWLKMALSYVQTLPTKPSTHSKRKWRTARP